MNVKYILSLLCLLMYYLVLQCVADETIAEIQERIRKENLAIQETYELSLLYYKKPFGSTLTEKEVVFVLGNCYRKDIIDYFNENSNARRNRGYINPDVLWDIVRKLCEK